MEKTSAEKVVCYVVEQEHLLVFTHLDVPIDVTGVQVPAGTMRPGEDPAAAAVREVREETGEHDPEHGGPQRWECRWMPLAQAHVLAGGLGAMVGSLYD